MAKPAHQTIFDGPYLRAVLAHPGPEHGRHFRPHGLFVSFDHWRKDRAGFPVMAPVATATAMGYASLAISSHANDWFLNPDLGPLRDVLAQLVPGYRVVRASGFSMGGYGALLFSQALRLDYVALFAPQVSIRTQIAPYERRWRAEAAMIDTPLAAAEDQLALTARRDLRGVIIFDPFYARAERLHARAIQAIAPGIGLAPMPFSRHPPTAVITAARRFADVQRAMIAGTLCAADMRRLHRDERENCQDYLDAMLAALKARGSAGAELL
jgi:hypothetical protein